MIREETLQDAKVVDTLIGRCVTIRDLLGKSTSLTHEIVGIPPEGLSLDEKQPISSLEILSSEIRTIHARAEVLLGQLERIKEKIGSHGME